MRLISLFAAAALLLPAAPPEFWPGATYDPATPTFQKVLGYQPGERISSHANLMRYMEALAAAYPTRMKIFEYAKSWENRKLIYAAIGSEANIRRLPEIQQAMQRLADPRKTADADAKKLMANLPAVVWLGYGVHGNEISSPDAALLTAYHLLAARNDKLTQDILANTLVLIDPTQNPDGRDRFVHNFEIAEGLVPDPDPASAEHSEPWPGGRTNHYYFDMNRDWFALTQPETRGRIKSLLQWFPLVFVDLHEMGSDSTYYFAPEADPFNPHLAKDIMESLHWVGKNNAKWFDKFGFSYFTREVYDNFYPGYGASWPCYYGGVAMTYEQSSARGLIVRRNDESVYTFRDTVRQHFVASLSTLETAAERRAQLLDKFYRFRKDVTAEGASEPVKEYLFPRTGNTSAVDKLADNLTQQGIEVKRTTAATRVDGKDLPAGSYIVSLAQPSKRLIRVLLDKHVPMEANFLKEQERRRARKLPDEIYDVTAWSLPLLYGVEMLSSGTPTQVASELVKPGALPAGKLAGPKAEVAYLIPWGTTAAARLAIAALRQDYKVWTSDKSFTQNGRKYPQGTIIIKVKENPDTLAAWIAKEAAASGVEVIPTNTGWVEDGINFGSRYVHPLKKPAVALAWDRPTSAGAAGQTRFVLERQFGLPVTVIRTAQINSADLSRYNTLILPEQGFGDGGYSTVLSNTRKLKDWMAAGGTLIALGSAVNFLADPKTALLAISRESRIKAGDTPKKPADDGTIPGQALTKQEEFDKLIQAEKESPDDVAGVLATAKVDHEHWMGAGLPATIHAMVSGRNIYTPIKLDKGINAAYFTGPEQVVGSGYMWEENRKQLAFKPLVVVQREGKGQVIAFTADPNFRAFMDGLNVLFMNAVLRGPARAR